VSGDGTSYSTREGGCGAEVGAMSTCPARGERSPELHEAHPRGIPAWPVLGAVRRGVQPLVRGTHRETPEHFRGEADDHVPPAASTDTRALVGANGSTLPPMSSGSPAPKSGLRASIARRVDRIQRRAPRFGRWVIVPARDMSDRVARDQLGVEAGSLTYGAFLSIPPLLLLAVMVTEVWLKNADAAARVIASAEDLVPGLGELLQGGTQLSTSSAVGTGLVGIVTLVWAASGFGARARQGLGLILGTGRTGLITERAVAIAYGIPVLLLLSAYIGAATWLTAITLEGLPDVVVEAGSDAALLAIGAVVWTIIYRWATPGDGPSLREHLPGGLALSVALVLLERVGTVYVDQVVIRSRALYGAVGALFGLFAFLYIAMWLFLLGAELTAARRDGTAWWAS
jgi:membrane protein